jgi:hypothetical protein
MDKRCTINVGTSGWTYQHWQSVFYPDEWHREKWLKYNTRHFDNDFEGHAFKDTGRLKAIQGII